MAEQRPRETSSHRDLARHGTEQFAREQGRRIALVTRLLDTLRARAE